MVGVLGEGIRPPTNDLHLAPQSVLVRRSVHCVEGSPQSVRGMRGVRRNQMLYLTHAIDELLAVALRTAENIFKPGYEYKPASCSTDVQQ